LYNLFTSANKSSYIDQFLDRGVNATSFSHMIGSALESNKECWFID